MGMDVRASGNGLHSFADGSAIFDHLPVFRQVAHSHFMAERNIAEQLDRPRSLAFKSHSTHV